MLYTEIFRSDLRRPQPVEPDPCTRIVARRGNYLSYLRRRVSDPDTAEDLLQDFNLKVIRASRRAGTIHNTEAWLSRVLRNTLFNHYRRCDARRRADATYAIHATALSASDGMEPDLAEADSADGQLTDIEQALARIRALQQPGTPDLQAKIIDLYLQSSAGSLDALRAAVISHDSDTLYQTAHTLKSSSANVGAMRVADWCKELEQRGREKQLADVERLLAGLEADYLLARKALQTYLETPVARSPDQLPKPPPRTDSRRES